MAAKKLSVSETSKKHGLLKMVEYAKEHGFKFFDDTYRIVKKHQKQRMKNIDAHGRQRISSRPSEYCEIMRVSTIRRSGEEICGYLVGYANGIRFDAHERY